MSMSTLTAKGNWNIAKGKLKQRLARVMHDDVQFFEGKVDELVGRIQKSAGNARKRKEGGGGGSAQCRCFPAG
jgi:uncharacterized protein YjbJ (UPF0337 family)